MTNQEAFSTVWEHFVVNKAPESVGKYVYAGLGEAEGCVYRGPNGTKCAFGVLIPDDLYEKSFEGRGADFVMRELSEKGYSEFDGLNEGFVRSLQAAHDRSTQAQDFSASVELLLRDLAKGYNLTIPEEG